MKNPLTSYKEIEGNNEKTQNSFSSICISSAR
jgi:hypothetical protein